MSTAPSLQVENDQLRNRVRELERQLLQQSQLDPSRALSFLDALVEGTAKETGEQFFASFVSAMGRFLGCRYVLISEHLDDPVSLARTVAFWAGNQLVDNIEYDLRGGPCEETASGQAAFFPNDIQRFFPDNHELVVREVESYCGVPLRANNGKVIGHISVMDDRPMDFNLCEVPALSVFVSRAAAELERKLIEHELFESKNSLQMVIKSAPVVITTVAKDGLVELFDGRAIDRVGFKPDQFVGLNYFDLWKDVPHLTRSMRNCLAGYPTDPTLTDVNGRQLETRFSPILNEEGVITGVTTVCVDVTERIHADVELRGLREKLTHVSRVSSVGEMASGLAHELNQPLAAIATYSFICQQFVESGNVGAPEFNEVLAKLSDQALRAGEIIKRIRALVENRQFKTEWVDISNPVNEVLKLLESSLRSNEISLNLNFEHGEELAPLDEIQIQQVMLNLIQNAIDSILTDEANSRTIDVNTFVNDDKKIVVQVVDSGAGFEANPQKVFETFFTTKSDGIGIGLSISKSIVEMHNGTLVMVPNHDQGVTFQMELPTQAS